MDSVQSVCLYFGGLFNGNNSQIHVSWTIEKTITLPVNYPDTGGPVVVLHIFP